MANVPFQVRAATRNIHLVDLDFTSKTDEWWFLLSGDRHHDNPHADHELELKHLEEAKARRAGIIDVGDLHCAMEGKFDPRRNKAGIREEHAMAPDYLDSLVRHAADFYAPYASNFVVIGRGNHESAILKNCETDITERLCERMSQMSGHKVHPGGYGGWVKFHLETPNNERYTLSLKYFHGAGGAALMSFDTLKVRRNAAVMPDADVIVQGHVHKQWFMPLSRERLVCDKHGCRVVSDIQFHVRTGTYKDEFGDGHSGWHIEQGRGPEVQGAVWMRLYLAKKAGRTTGGDSKTYYQLTPEFHLAH
jgi:hypothetical protein